MIVSSYTCLLRRDPGSNTSLACGTLAYEGVTETRGCAWAERCADDGFRVIERARFADPPAALLLLAFGLKRTCFSWCKT